MTENENLTPRRERFLRYWSANMEVAFATSQGGQWVGFHYTDEERARMSAIAAPMSGAAVGIFFTVVTIAFILIAAAAVVGFMLPVLTWLYPDPSLTKPLPFVLVLPSVCAFCLGLGFPLTVGLGAWAGDVWGGGVPGRQEPGDAALLAKVRMQLWRITLIMVGVFIPGCMLFILFDINAGPLVFWLKIACGALTLGSLFGAVKAKAS